MAVNKDFRVKKGLVVGENIDATSGNVSAVDVNASGTFSAGTFEPSNVTATGYVSSPSISADNFYGNITDATYSDLTIAGTTSASTIMLDSGTTVSDSDQWTTGGVTMHSSYANIGHGGELALFTIPMAKYRSGRCLVQAVAMGVGTNPSDQYAELMEFGFIHNGSTVEFNSSSSPVSIGNVALATLSADVVNTNVVIKATANSPDENTVQFMSTITLLHTTQV